MNGYLKSDEAEARWNITERQTQYQRGSGMGDGAGKSVTTRTTPEDAIKPARTGKLKPPQTEKGNVTAP
ncbi:MAG: hypothetical protein LBS62_00210 [Clostridiales bacterium]|jgi:hypothetical protein|nr:hypothetical protein [Clostridiales bacterium]